MLEIMWDIGHCLAEAFLCPAAVDTLLVIVTDGLNFVDINFYLIVFLTV